MNYEELIKWMLEGDVSIQYQVHRDLLATEQKDLQDRISKEGWGAKFLSRRNSDGHWGLRFYQPKWISSHYTLLDLRNLCISPENKIIRESLEIILKSEKGPDGGIAPFGVKQKCDVCVNGMFLNYASYFKSPADNLKSVVDFILSQHMKDGGFNCQSNGSGAIHSSLHTSLSVLEGITEYLYNGYQYKAGDMANAMQEAIEFILKHRLYISDRTGLIISRNFLKLPYPCRWKYDILRALDYLQYAKVSWDDRLIPALEVLIGKRKKDGTWNMYSKYTGQVHFEMEKAGKPSRWNTLRALRVLNYFEKINPGFGKFG